MGGAKKDKRLRLVDEAYGDLQAAQRELAEALPLIPDGQRSNEERALSYTEAALKTLDEL